MLTVFRRLAIAGAATVLLVSTFPILAHAATARPMVGVQFHATWSDYTDAERIEVLDKLAAAGVEWVRVDMGWLSYQSKGPGDLSDWHIDKADFIVDEARKRGIQVMGMLWYTPDWANGGAGAIAPPTDPAAYGDWAGLMAEHFRGRVSAWEIWNEPNHPSFFVGDASDYVPLLKAAYPEIKAADPNAKVVTAGLSYNDTGWIADMYEAGMHGYFDVLATHPYQGPADLPPEAADDGTMWRMAHVSKVREQMVNHGDGDKEIWFTEFGWSSHDNYDGIKNWMRGVTEQEQGDYFVRTIEYLKKNHPYVTNIFWYNERNRDHDNVQTANYGLLNRDLSAKPVYTMLSEYLRSDGGEAPEIPAADDPTADDGADSGSSGGGGGGGSDSDDSGSEDGASEEGSGSDDGVVAGAPTDETPTDDAPETPALERSNLLLNGGFEQGTWGWRMRGARLSTVSQALSGRRAGKVQNRRRGFRLSSASAYEATSTTFTAGGFVRGTTRGQVVRLVITERRDGDVVGRSTAWIRVPAGKWREIDDLVYRSPNETAGEITVQLRATRKRNRSFLVDDLWLRASAPEAR